MRGRIRGFTAADYGAVVAVHNAVFTDWPDSAEDWRHADRTCDPKCRWRRFVYEEDGRILAYGHYSQSAWMYHPRKFWLGIYVLPDHRRRGIGAALYDHVLRELAPLRPISVRNEINETHSDGIRFAEARGFKAGMREQESELDLTAFAPEAFAADLERAGAAGIAIRGFEELAGDPERLHKLYELDKTVAPDMPSPEPITQPDFESYSRQIFAHPRFFPEGYMIALEGSRYVGMSNLYRCEREGDLHTGFTGTLQEYRQRGIATALKVSSLGRAKALGYKRVMTWNDSGNAGMLGINFRLGFRKRPVWIDYEKVLDPEAAVQE